jgi:F420-non-reducing hydrogenase iron-sulfur subunit
LKICVLYCANSLETGELDLYIRKIKDAEFNVISLPCSGKVDIPYMIKAFETGADGVLVISCPEGKCHNLEGNLRAKRRAEAVDSLLEEVGMRKGRIGVIQLEEGDTERIIERIEEFINMNMEKTT